jgi:hypothetical protein
MPRRRAEAPVTRQEKAFFEALERLEKGELRHKDLCRKAAARKLKINMTTIAMEAGYNRTYLYKNHLPRVMAKIGEVIGEPPAPVRTSEDLIKRLREENADLRNGLKFAVNAARQSMERSLELEKERDRALRERDRFKNQAVNSAASATGKIVKFPGESTSV